MTVVYSLELFQEVGGFSSATLCNKQDPKSSQAPQLVTCNDTRRRRDLSRVRGFFDARYHLFLQTKAVAIEALSRSLFLEGRCAGDRLTTEGPLPSGHRHLRDPAAKIGARWQVSVFTLSGVPVHITRSQTNNSSTSASSVTMM